MLRMPDQPAPVAWKPKPRSLRRQSCKASSCPFGNRRECKVALSARAQDSQHSHPPPVVIAAIDKVSSHRRWISEIFGRQLLPALVPHPHAYPLAGRRAEAIRGIWKGLGEGPTLHEETDRDERAGNGVWASLCRTRSEFIPGGRKGFARIAAVHYDWLVRGGSVESNGRLGFPDSAVG